MNNIYLLLVFFALLPLKFGLTSEVRSLSEESVDQTILVIIKKLEDVKNHQGNTLNWETRLRSYAVLSRLVDCTTTLAIKNEVIERLRSDLFLSNRDKAKAQGERLEDSSIIKALQVYKEAYESFLKAKEKKLDKSVEGKGEGHLKVIKLLYKRLDESTDKNLREEIYGGLYYHYLKLSCDYQESDYRLEGLKLAKSKEFFIFAGDETEKLLDLDLEKSLLTHFAVLSGEGEPELLSLMKNFFQVITFYISFSIFKD